MNVDILQHTPNADRLVAATARGDKMDESLVGVDFDDEYGYAEVMEPIEYEDRDGDAVTEDVASHHIPYAGTKRAYYENEAKTRAFIRQMVQRGHWGPFEHPSITFAIEGISRSAMAQLTRHRHASFDVQSMRYVDFSEGEMVTPDSFEGVDIEVHPNGDSAHDGGVARETMAMARFKYKQLLDEGVPEEDARMVLPIGTKINMTGTMNLRSLFHILDLRENMKAQWEARELATEMRELATDVAPHCIEMYEEHTNNNSLRAP